MAKDKVDPRVDKRRVTMSSVVLRGYDDKGQPVLAPEKAVDYVRPDHLDAYVEDARTRWQHVEVSEEPDAGPGGYSGTTSVPEHLPLPDAGVVYPGEEDPAQDGKQKGGGGTGSAVLGILPLMLTLAWLAAFMRFAIQTATMKNTLSDAYKGAATFAAVYTTAPGGSAGTEPSGGSPAYARKATAWGSSANGVVSSTQTFDVPSGATLVGCGVHTAVTAGTYLDGTSVTSQAFASQGTYALTLTYTQT